MNDSTPYSVPAEPGRWHAIALAAVVHGALLGLLWFGIRWQSETPVAVEAEVWNPVAREAAPRAPQPLPEPEPVPQAIRPEPKPQPVREVPPVELPAVKTPDIALERERKRQEQQRARALEDESRRKELLARREADEQRRQKEQEQLAQQKQERQDRQLKELKAQQQRQQEQRIAQEADALAKKKADDQKKLAAEKLRKENALEEQRLNAQREENLRRLTDAAGATAGSGGSGDAARSQGPRADASYIQRVGAKIRSNTIFNGADELTSNPAVEFAVELLPDGSIRRLRKTKASGVPGFDDAVSRAIEKSQPFPPDRSGTAPSGFTVSHKPKDQ